MVMRLKKRLASGAAILTLTATSGILSATSAAAATAPSCVGLSQWESTQFPVRSYASVQNFCSGGKRVRLIWAWAGDGECHYLSPGAYYKESRLGRAPYVSEVRAC
jgi:hypothetical protein